MCRCKPDRTCTCHIDCGSGSDPGCQCSMIACRENVRQHGQVEYFFHGPLFIREHEKLEICVRHHYILRLAADPAAHVHIAVCCTRPVRVYVRTDMRLLFTTHFTASTGNVERDGCDIPFFDKLDIASNFNHFACNFMSEHQAFRRSGTAAHHVLVTAANVCRNDFKYYAMFTFTPDVRFWHTRTILQYQIREFDILDFNTAGSCIDYTTVSFHLYPSSQCKLTA